MEFEKVQESLPNLRLQESKVAAELQKYSISLENQEKELERANIAVDETKIRIEQIKNDIEREKFLFEDAKQNLERVQEEKSILLKQQGDLFIQTDDDENLTFDVLVYSTMPKVGLCVSIASDGRLYCFLKSSNTSSAAPKSPFSTWTQP